LGLRLLALFFFFAIFSGPVIQGYTPGYGGHERGH
jgi:hypothetical protein